MMPMNPAMPMAPQPGTQMPVAPMFGKKRPAQPQFSGIFTKQNANGKTRLNAKGWLTTAATSVTAAISLLGIHHQDRREQCVVETRGGKIEQQDKGWYYANPFFTKSIKCFDMKQPRVSMDVKVTALGNVEMNMPISLRWAPNKQHIAETYLKGMDNKGGDWLKNKRGDIADQIEKDENLAVFANLFSEEQNYLIGIASLIPPDKLRTKAALDAINDAFMNGYNPKEIFEKFAPKQKEGVNKGNPAIDNVVVENKDVPNFKTMVKESIFGKKNPAAVDIVDILDVDVKEATFIDKDLEAEYSKTAKKEVERQNAEKDIEIAKLKGQAQVEAATKSAEAAEELDTPEARSQRQLEIWSDTCKEATKNGAVVCPSAPNSGSNKDNTPSIILDSKK